MQDKQTHPLISIVVLNWNGLEDTKICLEHLRKLDYPNYEIIIVDNGSRSDSKEYLSSLKNIVYVDNPVNKGFTGGHIDGFKHSKGEFVVLLNNDAVMAPDYLSKALPHFKDGVVAAVGGRAYHWNEDAAVLDDSNPFYSYMDIDIYTGEAHMQSSDFEAPQEVNCVSGSAVMVRRSVIEEIGYLYDRFFAYFEETDLFARMKRAGYKVMYDPELRIWHRNGASSGASNGSYFFFYQIFRNRFIFAVRNFEPWFMRHFLLVYFKIGLVSALQVFRDPANKTMHRAYRNATLYNLFTLPKALISRHKLHTKLGDSQYNHQLYQEQSGVSMVIDGTELSSAQLQSLHATFAKDTNPLHEYVVVVKISNPPEDTRNCRYIIDRGYFSVHPMNLGCLAARHSWMALCTSEDLPNIQTMHEAIASTLRTATKAIAFETSSGMRKPYILLHKDIFELKGGLGSSNDSQELITHTLQYAHALKALKIIPTTPIQNDSDVVPLENASDTIKQLMADQIKFDIQTRQASHITWFGRMKNKYYRLFQVATFVKWLLMHRVPTRLKLARLKNLFTFSIALRVGKLAEEFKHTRNEVLLYGGQHAIVEGQRITIEKKLEIAKKDSSQIPIFIICRDRLSPLLELVAWLEQKGLRNIVLIDNDSSYPPLMDFYQKTPYQVLKLLRNVGHTSPWKLSITRALAPDDFYIVTDPDVIPTEECPDDAISHFLDIHKQYFAYKKVGFGLRIDDLPDHYHLKQHVIDWESQFFVQELSPGVYEAGVDTTFALYKPFTYTYTLHPSIRTGHPYVARHLPWYSNPKEITQEEAFYRYRVDSSVNSWNTDTLPERYAAEMKNS